MRFGLLAAFFLVGTAFFAVLPVYAPFVVLQTEEVPRFLAGLAAAAVAGATLGSVAGGRARGTSLVLACTFVGACVYAIVYAIPDFGFGEWWPPLDVLLVLYAFAYTVIPAAVGLMLAWLTRSLVARFRRSLRRP